jgi:hypothetical protein
MNSGNAYSFAEKGAERVLSNKDSMAYGRGGSAELALNQTFSGITNSELMKQVGIESEAAALRVIKRNT